MFFRNIRRSARPIRGQGMPLGRRSSGFLGRALGNMQAMTNQPQAPQMSSGMEQALRDRMPIMNTNLMPQPQPLPMGMTPFQQGLSDQEASDLNSRMQLLRQTMGMGMPQQMPTPTPTVLMQDTQAPQSPMMGGLASLFSRFRGRIPMDSMPMRRMPFGRRFNRMMPPQRMPIRRSPFARRFGRTMPPQNRTRTGRGGGLSSLFRRGFRGLRG